MAKQLQVTYIPGPVGPDPPDAAEDLPAPLEDQETVYRPFPRQQVEVHAAGSWLELLRADIDHQFRRGDR